MPDKRRAMGADIRHKAGALRWPRPGRAVRFALGLALAASAALYLLVVVIVDGSILPSPPHPRLAVITDPLEPDAPALTRSLTQWVSQTGPADANAAQAAAASNGKTFYGFQRHTRSADVANVSQNLPKYSNWSAAAHDAASGDAGGEPSPQVAADGKTASRTARRLAFDAKRTFKTMCVRLCDGYFFPLSQSVTPDAFAHEAGRCQAQCGAPSELYVVPTDQLSQHSDPDMMSLTGRAYSDLKTAYAYRTRYAAGCSCKAQPWTTAAAARHTRYANNEPGPITERLAAAEHADQHRTRQREELAARTQTQAKLEKTKRQRAAKLRAEKKEQHRKVVADRARRTRAFGEPFGLGAHFSDKPAKGQRQASRSFYTSNGRTTQDIFRNTFMGGFN